MSGKRGDSPSSSSKTEIIEITIADNGNLILLLHDGYFEHRYKVSKDVLVQASPYWKNLIEGDFKEAKQNEIELEGDNPPSMLFLLRVLHGKLSSIPENTMFDEMCGLATLCDKYHCADVVHSVAESYLNLKVHVICTSGNEGPGLTMLWDFKCAALFKELAKELVLTTTIDDQGRCMHTGKELEIQRPSNMVDRISSTRYNTITALLDAATAIVDRTLSNVECKKLADVDYYTHYRKACGNMSLGTLVAGLSKFGLPYHRPSADEFSQNSIKSLYKSLTDFVFPNFHDNIDGVPGTHEACNLGDEWRKAMRDIVDNMSPLTDEHRAHFQN